MDRPMNLQPGYVVSINEKREGLIRLVDSDDETEYPFDRSTIVLDGRFMNDIIVGAQFFCEIDTDDSGERKLSRMYPRDTMYFEGVIKAVHRLEGIAEIEIPTLATPVAFGRAHLDHPDDFKKILAGDKLQVEINFYNLVAKQKPLRATRVILCQKPSELEDRLRPALRRSSSFPSRPRTESEYSDDDGIRLRRGYGASFHDDMETLPQFFHNHQGRPMYMPPVARVMPPHAQFPMYPPGAGWIPTPAGCMPLPPTRRVPCSQGFPGVPSLYPPVCPFGRGSWGAPGYREEMGRHGQERSRREHLSSVLNRSEGSLNGHVDDSDVVIELTVEELRKLMLERPRSSSQARDDDQ